VKDAGHTKFWDGAKPYAYFLPAQLGHSDGSSRLHVRVAGYPVSMLNPIRRMFESFGPEAKVRDTRTMAEEMESMLAREQATAIVLSLFGGLALLLPQWACMGSFPVRSHSAAGSLESGWHWERETLRS
jgi:hypothetical protein